MIHIYHLILFILFTSLTACLSTQTNLTSINNDEEDIGLGGTGLLANNDIGLGGTGITGTITGFGSIFVNGVEIEYNNQTSYTLDGKNTQHRTLQIGDVVEVLTTNLKQHTHAHIINIRHEVIGQVDSVNLKTSSFTVLGQTILQSKTQTLPLFFSNS